MMQDLCDQHDRLVEFRAKHRGSPSLGPGPDSLLRFFCYAGWAGGCSILNRHQGLGFKLCVARQLAILREAKYELCPPEDIPSVKAILKDSITEVPFFDCVVDDLPRLTEIMQQGL